jgi:hypothetical protein
VLPGVSPALRQAAMQSLTLDGDPANIAQEAIKRLENP